MAILMYHHVGECPTEQEGHHGLWVTEKLFHQQLSWLSEHGWRGVTLDEMADGLAGGRELPDRWVAITFDDGWRDNFTSAAPLLAETGFPATIFMVTQKIRCAAPAGQWDEYVSAEEIRQMIASGIEFGSHTRTHPRLTSLHDDQIRDELVGSRGELKEITGSIPSWFCYPYGNFSPRVARIVQEAGYRGAVSTIRDNRPKLDQLFWLPRVMVRGDTTPRRLSYSLSTAYHLLHTYKNRKRWKHAH